MRLRRLAIPTLLGLGVLAQVSSAGAQEQLGYAENHYTPSERGSQWFALDSLDLRGNGRLALGVVNDYSFRSLVKYGADGSTRASIVKDQFVMHLGGAVFLGDRVRVGFNVPLQLYANGRDTVINGITHRGADSSVAVGDVRISSDVRLFGEHTDTATLAAGAEFFVPSGSLVAYTGDGKPRLLPRLLFAGRASSFVYAAKLGVMIRGRDEDFGEGRIGTAVVGGVSAGLSLMNDALIIGPEVFGSTVVSNSRAFDTQTTPVEGMLGAHLDVGNNMRLGLGGGTLFSRGYGAPVARGLLSIEWVPGDPKPEAAKAEPTKDRDGDGVPDCEDACGFTPGVKTASSETNGCPADTDLDGVPDNVDACATVPGVRTPDARTNGCPADADDDGIPDVEDSCPRQPGKRTDNPRSNGCPDLDNDGIIDLHDACPDVPGVRSTDRKKNGCPADSDRDKDGVNDDVDACPDEAGKADPDPKKNGCPKAFLKAGAIEITEQVKFKTGSAELAGKESDDLLNAVKGVLAAHPEIKKLRVEGHTDNKGDAAQNKKLSQARAETVAKWLTDHGVDKARLSSAGFGIEKPIDSNETEAGRTNNRRVEFHVEQGSAK
jgi:outer membrane protein OmpA-like peptidoglycan-associated protein